MLKKESPLLYLNQIKRKENMEDWLFGKRKEDKENPRGGIRGVIPQKQNY